MAAGRVKSKNLFNFRPTGKVDDDIVEMEKPDPNEHECHDGEELNIKTMSDEDYGCICKTAIASQLKNGLNHPLLKEGENSCDHSVLKVPTSHDGNFEVTVLVHAPKILAGDESRPCIVYAHGGGAVGGSAELYKPLLSFMAMNCEVVVFNVDYRLAPEARCPNNILDFYSVMKYVSSNAAELGVDPARLAIAGESGGGYICAGAMVQLARQGEAELVKLAVVNIPMLSDYCFGDPAAMSREEAAQAEEQRKIWRLLAGPGMIDEMSGDALLYPGKADEETLSKMPPAIVWEAEFDMYYTEATRFARRLRAAGRLLELVVIPGAKHGSGMTPGLACHKVDSQAFKLAIQEYLVK